MGKSAPKLSQSAATESQTHNQLVTEANGARTVCDSQLTSQAATLSSDADALDDAIQMVTNDMTQ